VTFPRTQASVLRVNIAHRKTQADQKLQSDRTFALDKRIDETNILFQSLWDRIEGAYDNSYELRQDLASFEERLNVCQAAISDFESSRNKSPQPVSPPAETIALVEREDVKASVDTLFSLVEGIIIFLLSPVLLSNLRLTDPQK
jgi:septal ring factor EnvC (AmiA/AmiB activator)